jgi:hypothetical protein
VVVVEDRAAAPEEEVPAVDPVAVKAAARVVPEARELAGKAVARAAEPVVAAAREVAGDEL